jgi:Family of unknown function (DUF6494)
VSVERFLNKVCATSQREIDEAIRKSPEIAAKSFKAKAVITVAGLNIVHVVSGSIEG